MRTLILIDIVSGVLDNRPYIAEKADVRKHDRVVLGHAYGDTEQSGISCKNITSTSALNAPLSDR